MARGCLPSLRVEDETLWRLFPSPYFSHISGFLERWLYGAFHFTENQDNSYVTRALNSVFGLKKACCRPQAGEVRQYLLAFSSTVEALSPVPRDLLLSWCFLEFTFTLFCVFFVAVSSYILC